MKMEMTAATNQVSSGSPSLPAENMTEAGLVRQSWYGVAKVVVDFLLALTLLLLTGPVLLLAMLLIRLTSPGPAIYRQVRLGKNRRPFTIYKLRTMIHDCERFSGVRWATVNDPRVTPLGHILRKLHLDELPQLVNVLRGEMSLVGPRPERPEFIPKLEQALPHYAERLLVRPGLTGLAQVQLPPDSDLESVRRKLACDRYYVRKMGLSLDLRLLVCTAAYLVRIPFCVAGRWLRLPDVETAEQALPVSPARLEADLVLQMQSA